MNNGEMSLIKSQKIPKITIKFQTGYINNNKSVTIKIKVILIIHVMINYNLRGQRVYVDILVIIKKPNKNEIEIVKKWMKRKLKIQFFNASIAIILNLSNKIWKMSGHIEKSSKGNGTI
jgi:hypothetical protein